MSQAIELSLEDPRWEAFLDSRPEATPFHHIAWSRVLGECYGFPTFAFALVSEQGVVAGVPLAAVRGPTLRRRWVALPFTDELRPLGEDADVDRLTEALEAHRRESEIASVEIRAAVPNGSMSTHGTSHILRLDREPSELLSSFHPSQVRRNITRAEREGVQVRVASREEDMLETFYRLHLETRRRQGVPIQPRRFFALLWERIVASGLGFLLIAEHGERPVAAAVFLQWNGTAIYKFGASDRSALALRPNHALFWEAIQRAKAAGARALDFGRTDIGHESLRAFKASWGTEEHDIVHTTFGRPSAPTPRGGGRLGGVLAFTIKRSPTWVCRAVGETVYRYAA